MSRSGWILAVLASIALLPANASADTAEPLYDPTAVVPIEFQLSDESRAALDADPDTYVPAEFRLTLAGQTSAWQTVGLKLKGSTSFRTLAGKAALKLKFKEFGGPTFMGLKKLTLNNMVQDPSMLRETLSYELFRAAGVPAPRTGYAFVTINGAAYGVYLNVETMDGVALTRWFASTQHLLEGGPNVDVRTADLASYEVDEGDEADLSDLAALVSAVEGSGGSFTERLSAVANLDEMTTEWAVEKFAGSYDNYTYGPETHFPNNYYLHSDDAGVFSMLPWGTDETLAATIPFDGPGGILYEGCRTDPSCWERFRAALATLPDLSSDLDLLGQTATLSTMLEPWQELDPRREQTMQQIAAAVDDTREFLQFRSKALHDPAYWIHGPPIADPSGSPPTQDPPAEARDTAAPETTITRAPRARIATKRARAHARFRFESSEPGSTFECRVDDGAWGVCGSPQRLRVNRGRHRFRVRAIDPSGNVDPTPARERWSVHER